MDPLSVLKTMWTHKWVTMPVVLLTILACVYGMLWAPREYESSATYALAMPKVPTELEIEQDPTLGKLNADNPYLRWRDTGLLAQVVMARVNSADVEARLESRGLAVDYELAASDGTGSGIMRVVVTAKEPETAAEGVAFLSEEVDRIVYEVQKVNDAHDTYLIEVMPVGGPVPPEEVFSSRLRATAVLGAAGMVLLFGAVSIAESISTARRRAVPRTPSLPTTGHGPDDGGAAAAMGPAHPGPGAGNRAGTEVEDRPPSGSGETEREARRRDAGIPAHAVR